jgi:hypothetical protein
METTSPRIRSLLRQADKIAESGKRSAAEKLYRQIIDEAPETTNAWTGLATVLRDPAQKEAALQRALEIDPENTTAIHQLAILHGEIPAETEPPEEVLAQDTNLESEQHHEASIVAPPSEPDVRASEGGADEMLLEPIAAEVIAEETVSGEEDDHILEHDDHILEQVQEVLYCANHPHRETHLRCNRCGKPICSSCAKSTPVGYRCPECIREHEEIYYTATTIDYIVAVTIALPLSVVAGYLATLIGIFVIFLAAAAGNLIGRLVFRAVGKRRGRWIPQLVSGAIIFGGILAASPYLYALLLGNIGISFRLLWVGIYIFIASGAAYYQMR